MTHGFRALLLALASCATWSCARGPSAYDRALDAADARARERKPAEAAALYREAARSAETTDLAVEAGYREAWMWKKAGDLDRALACLERLTETKNASSRSARIWLDIGRFRDALGDQEGARTAYRKVLEFPESGLPPRAADALVRSQPGPASSAYAELLSLAPAGSHLDAFLRLRTAQALVQEGDLNRAITTAEELARRHPLPIGVYTDDALLLAARSRRSLGDARGALLTIDAILAAEEKAALVGSYERPAYAEARWLAADIHQHDRHEIVVAESVLDELVQHDATSRLQDDALFRSAWLARSRGATELACQRARTLAELDPPSVLADCVGQLCDSLSQHASSERRCRRAVTMAAGGPAAGGQAAGGPTAGEPTAEAPASGPNEQP